MGITWEDGFTIHTSVTNGEVCISANKEGMISLAHILLGLADAAPGAHVHLDAYNSLEDGSTDLIIERIG